MRPQIARLCTTVAVIAAVASALNYSMAVPAKDTRQQTDAAVERTRRTVRMLDDIYKTAVVLITEKYVHDQDDFPAGSAAIALFDAVKKKGWHEVRLLDATGEPIDDKNLPREGFESDAVNALKNGKKYYEQLMEKDGKRYLQAATPVPVVLEKCVMCHAHYTEAQKGEPIGALSYTLPIE